MGSIDLPPEVLNTVIHYGIRVVGALVLLVATFMVAKWVKSSTYKSMKRSNLDETLNKFFSNAARYLVLIVGIMAVLGLFGINVTSLTAILAALGFAVGLAMQGTLSNFSAGVMLLIFRPFGVGDKVEVNGVSGTVQEIGLFTTTLDTPDNRRLIVPNGNIFGSTIENVNFHPIRRVDVNLGTDYPADLDETREVLESVAREIQPEPLRGKEPEVYLNSLGDSALDWTIKVWTRTEDYWETKQAITHRVKEELDEAGIGIPYPQMDMHVHGNLEPNAE